MPKDIIENLGKTLKTLSIEDLIREYFKDYPKKTTVSKLTLIELQFIINHSEQEIIDKYPEYLL